MADLGTSSILGIGRRKAVSIVQTQHCSRKMIYGRGKGPRLCQYTPDYLAFCITIRTLCFELWELWPDMDRLSYIAFLQLPSYNNPTTNSTKKFNLVDGTIVVEQVLSNRSGYLLTFCYSGPDISHRNPWNEQRIVSRKMLSKMPYI